MRTSWYLSELTCSSPFVFLGPGIGIHTLPLINKKACPCPKAYPMSGLICPQAEAGPFLLSSNLGSIITLLMKPLLRIQFKILNCPLPPRNAPSPPCLCSVFLHSIPHLLRLLLKSPYLSISSTQRQCFFGVLFPYVSSEFRTVVDKQFTLNKYLLNEWAAAILITVKARRRLADPVIAEHNRVQRTISLIPSSKVAFVWNPENLFLSRVS